MTDSPVRLRDSTVRLPDSPVQLARLIDAATVKLAEAPLGLVADGEVGEIAEVLETARRRTDGVCASVLMEVSDRELFRASGHTTLKRYYAQELRLGAAEAKRRLAVAEAITPAMAMTGQKLPPKREPLAAAVASGVTIVNVVGASPWSGVVSMVTVAIAAHARSTPRRRPRSCASTVMVRGRARRCSFHPSKPTIPMFAHASAGSTWPVTALNLPLPLWPARCRPLRPVAVLPLRPRRLRRTPAAPAPALAPPPPAPRWLPRPCPWRR